MKDFRLVAGFHHHDKIVELGSLLGTEGCWAWVCLLSHVAQFRPDGGLKSVKWAALAAQWRGNPDQFIDALVELKLVDRDEDGALSIHDWFEHNPFAVGDTERKSHARAAAIARWNRHNPGDSSDARGNARGNAQTAENSDRADALFDPIRSDPDKSKELRSRKKSGRQTRAAEPDSAGAGAGTVDEHGRPLETDEQRAAALALIRQTQIDLGRKLGANGSPAAPGGPDPPADLDPDTVRAQEIIEQKRRDRAQTEGK